MVRLPNDEARESKREFVVYLAIIIACGVALGFILNDVTQTLTATIFLATVVGTLIFWQFRIAISFLGLILLLLTRTLSLSEAIEFMDLEVVLLMMGMMIIIAMLRQASFFRWLLVRG